MLNRTLSPTPIHSHLRVIRDEDAPVYDAAFEPRPQPAGGFAMMPVAVFDTLAGDGYAIAVYAVLVKHANKEGVCWPSVATICKALGWSRKVVEPAINRLVEAGLIAKQKRLLNGMDQSNMYRISAKVQVVPTERAVVPTAPLGSSHGTSGTFPQNYELDPIELNTKELESTPLPPLAFDCFWTSYLHNGRSSKPQSEKLWKALSPEDQRAALDAIPLFKAGSDWQRGYAPGAQVWLRGRRWEAPPSPVINGSVNGKPPDPFSPEHAAWERQQRIRLGWDKPEGAMT